LDRAGAKVSYDRPTIDAQSMQNEATARTYHAEHGEAGRVGQQNITCAHRGNPVFFKTAASLLKLILDNPLKYLKKID
jgi:hypothetical protein